MARIPDSPGIIGENFKERHWFRGPEGDVIEKLHISEPYKSAAKEAEWMVAVSIPIRRGHDDEPAGVLLATIRSKDLLTWVDELNTEVIVLSGGDAVAPRDFDFGEKSPLGPEDATWLPSRLRKELLEQDLAFKMSGGAHHGVSRFIVSVPVDIQADRGYEWAVVVSTRLEDVFEHVVSLHSGVRTTEITSLIAGGLGAFVLLLTIAGARKRKGAAA